MSTQFRNMPCTSRFLAPHQLGTSQSDGRRQVEDEFSVLCNLKLPGCLHVSLSCNRGGRGQAEAELRHESQEIGIQVLAQPLALW